MTQREKILNYIAKYGSITQLEATYNLGITKLATRVSEMRRDGIIIKGEMVKGKNRDGEPTAFMRYSNG